MRPEPGVIDRVPELGPDRLPVGLPSDYGIPTLGYDYLAWGEEFLAQPDGDAVGDAWRYSDAQARWNLWWYAVDEFGRFLFTRGQVVLAKGSGKSPQAAADAATNLCGPVQFDGFDAEGEAVGRPAASPLVQLAAVSQDQTDNTMSLVISMLERGSASEVVEGLDAGMTRIKVRGGKLVPVTASPNSREGGRSTYAVLDETHHWMRANGGIELARTVRRNLAKMKGRSIETTNSWIPGLGSVAESTGEAAELMAEGRTAHRRLLQWHRQAPAETVIGDLDSLREGLQYVYGICPWIGDEGVDRFIEEIQDPNTPVEQARRFYLNQIVTASDQLIAPTEWDPLACQETLQDGDEITLGFDGGRTDDATVLVACRVSDRLFQPIGIWERPLEWDENVHGQWEVDKSAVDGVVRATMAKYRVSAFLADPALWESYIDQWSADYRSDLLVKASPQSHVKFYMGSSHLKEVTLGNERLMSAIADGLVKHTGDAHLRRHVMNARRRPNQFGVSFGKDVRRTSRKNDAYSGMLLADMARAKVLESGKRRGSRKVVVL